VCLLTDWMQEYQQFFSETAETELVNYVKSGDPMVKMCGI